MMRKMSYVIFSDNKLLTICGTFPKAIKSLPKDSEDTHIFDEDKEKVFFFCKGKMNGILNKKEDKNE
jgi:hypothetical protein